MKHSFLFLVLNSKVCHCTIAATSHCAVFHCMQFSTAQYNAALDYRVRHNYGNTHFIIALDKKSQI